MNFRENIALAFVSIRTNRLRSFLTMLGIIIGISAVITITTIGQSLQSTLRSSLGSIGGANQISAMVSFNYNWDDYNEEEYEELSESAQFTFEDLEGYYNEYSDEVNAVVVSNGNWQGDVTGPSDSAKVNVQGISQGLVEAQGQTLIAGRDITFEDNDRCAATCVVSDYFVKYAYGGVAPLGERIEIELQDGTVIKPYVVGVYKYKEELMSSSRQRVKNKKNITTDVFVPCNYMDNLMGVTNTYSYANIFGAPGYESEQIADDFKEYFNSEVFGNSENYYIETYTLEEELKAIGQVLDVLSIAISFIASISLLVGGVGVMNIMLVSVIERTREIGIRKALGAKNNAIEMQFLTEAVVICMIGGVIGILVGVLSGFGIALVAGNVLKNSYPQIADFISISVSPSPVAIAVSVIFSMLVGAGFGFYPARKAARMSPIDALRYE